MIDTEQDENQDWKKSLEERQKTQEKFSLITRRTSDTLIRKLSQCRLRLGRRKAHMINYAGHGYPNAEKKDGIASFRVLLRLSKYYNINVAYFIYDEIEEYEWQVTFATFFAEELELYKKHFFLSDDGLTAKSYGHIMEEAGREKENIFYESIGYENSNFHKKVILPFIKKTERIEA